MLVCTFFIRYAVHGYIPEIELNWPCPNNSFTEFKSGTFISKCVARLWP